MKISNETKVGVLAAIAIVILILGYRFLTGQDTFAREDYYYALYERTEGLDVSDPVHLNGYRIGRVSELKLLPEKNARILVKFGIKDKLTFPVDSRAKIVSLDLLGQKAVQIIPGKDSVMMQPGDTFYAEIQEDLTEEVKREILPVKKKAEDLMSSLDSVITIIQTIILEARIEKSMASLEKAMQSFANAAANLDSIIYNSSDDIEKTLENVAIITENIKNNNENITRLLENLASLSDTLNAAEIGPMVAAVKDNLEQTKLLLEQINQGDGTIGKLLRDEQVYKNLEDASKSLDELLTDLKENPGRYVHFSVFGKKDNSAKKEKK